MSETTSDKQYPIFVYGTLRPGAQYHSVVRSFVDEAKAATLQGYQMYSFGRFPGIVAQFSPLGVKGTLLFIKPEQYEACLQRLDRYESAGWLFNRVIGHAEFDYSDEPIRCWLYVVNTDNMLVSPSNIIRTNDWFEYSRG